MGTTVRRAWYVAGSRPRVSVTGSRHSVNMLAAVTHEGETFTCFCPENLTQEHGARFIEALRARFGPKLRVVLDNAPYFNAGDVHALAGDHEGVQLWYLPAYSPELNPVEELWRQLEEVLGNRVFEDVEAVRRAVLDIWDELSTPVVSNYLCP